MAGLREVGSRANGEAWEEESWWWWPRQRRGGAIREAENYPGAAVVCWPWGSRFAGGGESGGELEVRKRLLVRRFLLWFGEGDCSTAGLVAGGRGVMGLPHYHHHRPVAEEPLHHPPPAVAAGLGGGSFAPTDSVGFALGRPAG